MLYFESSVPEGVEAGARCLVLLHGRGSDERDLLRLRRHLPTGSIVVTPRAPFSAGPWGYGPGWAWYRFLGGDRPEEESFRHSQGELAAFLEALPSTLPVMPGDVVLGGFSQGGTMSLGFGLRDRSGVRGVMNFSGFLPDHPDVPLTRVAAGGLRVFWGHGIHDPAIPFALAERGRRRLREFGAELVSKDYGIGHGIVPQELADVSAWIDELTEGPTNG